MDDDTFTAESSSSGKNAATSSCSNPPKRVPVWKRHVFPATPVGSSDPFELPSNLTPALKRVKSRAKLPGKGSGATASLSKLPTFNKCQSASATAAPSLRCSPRKNSTSAKASSDCDANLREKNSSDFRTSALPGGDNCTAEVPTPSRARSNLFPTTLPPKKPRLSFMHISTSELRPSRKPVIVEPNYEQIPTSTNTLSRMPKAYRHSSINLRLLNDKDSVGEGSSRKDVFEVSAAPSRPQLSHSRSTMCLRLTPERDMRERRKSEVENTVATTPSATPKKRLRPSVTMTDLQSPIVTPTRRGRRISLSEANEEKSHPKPERKRSSSLDVRSQTSLTAASRRSENRVKPVLQRPAATLTLVECSEFISQASEINSPLTLQFQVSERDASSAMPNTDTLDAETAVDDIRGIHNSEVEKGTPDPNKLATVRNTQINDSPEKAVTDLKVAGSASIEVPEEEKESVAVYGPHFDMASAPRPRSPCLENAQESSKSLGNNSEVRPALTSKDEGEIAKLVEELVTAAEQSYFMEFSEPAFELMLSNTFDAEAESRSENVTPEAENEKESTMASADACCCSTEAMSSTSACPAEGPSNNVHSYKVNANQSGTQAVSNTALNSSSAHTSPDKRVRFKTVSVYYFARTQGMSTVPKTGEVSLGMVDKHFTKRQFPLWLGRRPELTLPKDYEEELSEGEDPGDVFDPEGLERCTAHQLPMFEGKTRIKMLKRSGVHVQKDAVETLESIRQSRIMCGCQCDGICIPDTCQCSLDGIGCQVDGPDEFGRSHPCSCTSVGCSNPYGRIEFDPEHVKNHYRITMMRMHHAEQKGIYDSPQRIRFNSDGEPESVSHFTPPPIRPNSINGALTPGHERGSADSDDPPTRKFPVTPVYMKSNQKRALRMEFAADPDTTALLKVKTRLLWQESASAQD